MKKYLSVGRVSESLMTLSLMKSLSCFSTDDVRMLRGSYAANTEGAIEFAIQCHWLEMNGSYYEITQEGASILDAYTGIEINQPLWMAILHSYISYCKPSWGGLIPSGRKEASLFMSNDERRCFAQSGLLDSISDSVIKWWDKVSELYRSEKEISNTKVGRQGERLSFIFETNRVSRSPIWESIESNKVGYDLISSLERQSNDPLYIEVKSSTNDIHHSVAHISRHEWDVSRSPMNINKYLFHFWLLGHNNRLAIITPEDLKKHVPIDSGGGKWNEFEIPFSIFEQSFQEISF